MRIHYNLRDKNAAEKTSIFLVVRHFGKNLRYSTGHSISPTLWDVRRNRPKAGQLPHVRIALNQLEEKAEKGLMDAGNLSQTEFKNLMDKVMGKVDDGGKTPYLLQFIREYIQNKNMGILKSTGTMLVNFALGAAYTKWGGIEWDKVKGKDVRFDAIDWNWHQRFYNYCVDQGLQASYIKQTFRIISLFLNASRPTHHNNQINKTRGWADIKNGDVHHTPIALTLEEVNMLATLELNEDDAKTRDLFLIGLYSGQRYSDFSTIQPNQVKGGRVHFIQKKTKSKTAIPLNLWAGLVPETLGEILERYGNTSPTLPTCRPDIYLNERMQFICRRAGITEQVEVFDRPGRELNVMYLEKWQKVRSHTARKSFCTIWHRGGMSLASIAKFSGHRSVDQLKAYIGLSSEEHLQAAEREAETARAVMLAKAI